MRINTGSQFAVAVMLVMLVRKGIITEQEMKDFYEEIREKNRIYGDGSANFEGIINKMLEVRE